MYEGKKDQDDSKLFDLGKKDQWTFTEMEKTVRETDLKGKISSSVYTW